MKAFQHYSGTFSNNVKCTSDLTNTVSWSGTTILIHFDFRAGVLDKSNTMCYNRVFWTKVITMCCNRVFTAFCISLPLTSKFVKFQSYTRKQVDVFNVSISNMCSLKRSNRPDKDPMCIDGRCSAFYKQIFEKSKLTQKKISDSVILKSTLMEP